MRKALKYGSVLLMTGGLIFFAYYLYVVNSGGGQHIRYIEPEGDYPSFSEIIQHPDLKGKVVYVDFWHTGCGPCLKEFKSVPELKARFAGEQDLAFLYLGKDRSVPGEKFRWKKMIEAKQLKGYHFFMSDEKFHLLWGETVQDKSILKAFPHYLIVGRNGEVLNNRASRPSQPAAVAELEAALAL